MNAKKQKLEKLSTEERKRVSKSTGLTFAIVAIVCVVLVGCFACSQETPREKPKTDEQIATYWTAKLVDVRWTAQTDASQNQDGIFSSIGVVSDAFTTYDSKTGLSLDFKADGFLLLSGKIRLKNSEGELVISDEDIWKIKFSEKNEIMYMTITDSDGKTVYYNSN